MTRPSLAGCILALVLAGCARGGNAPDFTLQSDSATPWTLSSQRGHAVVLDFGFTHCPDTCPATLAKLAKIVRELGAQAGGVTVAFVTVDPARDTPPVLHAYLSRFDANGRLVGLTGTPEQVDAVLDKYHLWAQRVPGTRGSHDYDVSHSSVVLLIDARGNLRGARDDDDSPAALGQALREVM